jgi:hypothetical protein
MKNFPRAVSVGLVVAALGSGLGYADVQAQTVEEMRRMVEEAKKAKAKAQAKAPPRASVASGKHPGKPTAAAGAVPNVAVANTAPLALAATPSLDDPIRIRFTSDAECELKVNEEVKRPSLTPDKPIELELKPRAGYQFECASVAFPGVVKGMTQDVHPDKRVTAHFNLIWAVQEERKRQMQKATTQ